jgi:hypothetical protein
MGRAETMIRAQLPLTVAQRRRLEQIARREGRSLSDVVRRALDAGLDVLEGRTHAALQQQLRALDELRQMRQANQALYGVFQGDLVAESREERDQDMERLCQG